MAFYTPGVLKSIWYSHDLLLLLLEQITSCQHIALDLKLFN